MRFENLKVKTRGLTISPIVQEDDLYLRDFGIWQDGELYDTPAKLTSKLVRCFRQVWGSVPDDCRMALKRLWKHDSPRHKQAEPGSGLPHIVINDRWIDEAPFKAACRSGIEFGFITATSLEERNAWLANAKLSHTWQHGDLIRSLATSQRVSVFVIDFIVQGSGDSNHWRSEFSKYCQQ